jgi:hypothetical protein
MVRDVYAGDVGPVMGEDCKLERRATFHIVADAGPDTIARIGDVLNLLCVAPRQFRMEVSNDIATVRAIFESCTEAKVELIARKLTQLILVHSVDVCCEALGD